VTSNNPRRDRAKKAAMPPTRAEPRPDHQRRTAGANATNLLGSAAKKQRVLDLYRDALARGITPGIRPLAKSAGCSHQFIYDNCMEELRQILADHQGKSPGQLQSNKPTYEDIDADRIRLRDHNKQLRNEVAILSKRLDEYLGVEAAEVLTATERAALLGDDAAKSRIKELEKEAIELRNKVFDLSEENRALKLRAQIRQRNTGTATD